MTVHTEIETSHQSFANSVSAERNISVEKERKQVVICGFCGAQETVIGLNKTECPNCDEDIY